MELDNCLLQIPYYTPPLTNLGEWHNSDSCIRNRSDGSKWRRRQSVKQLGLEPGFLNVGQMLLQTDPLEL